MSFTLNEMRDKVREIYGGRCVIHTNVLSLAIHEEPPRSLNPRWKTEPWTWWPLCYDCHEEAHRISRDEFELKLHQAQEQNFPGVKDKLHGLIETTP
jgi:5-methylcytosine-specific restriction endonuclease McrA